jgi:hypothetical protein
MSNLNLPTMTPLNLAKLIRPGQSKTVAYATTIDNVGGSFYVSHHGNHIAMIGTWEVIVSNAGWGSSTTRTRLNAILHDNGIRASVTQKNWEQKLIVSGDAFTWDWEHATTHAFSRAAFEMIAGTWTLTGISASQYGALAEVERVEVAA